MSRTRIAIALIVVIGAIHLIEFPEYLEEQPYIGVLFIAGAVGCALVAWLLSRDALDRRAWTLGTLISLGMAVGFVLSRTVGLPGFHEEEWDLSGIISVIAELGFAGIAAGALAGAGRRQVAAQRW